MNFGDALEAMKSGDRVSREGWNGKGMWVAMMPAFTIAPEMINERTRKFVKGDEPLNCGSYLVLMAVQGIWQPGWAPSQADMFADDWCVEGMREK